MYFTQCTVWAPKENQNNCKYARPNSQESSLFFFSRFSSFLSFHPSKSNVGVEFGGQTCYIGGSPSIGSIHQWAGPDSGKIYISYQIQTPTDITSRFNFQMVTPAAGGGVMNAKMTKNLLLTEAVGNPQIMIGQS